MQQRKLTAEELKAARENLQKDEQPVQDAIRNVDDLQSLVDEVRKPKPKK